MDRLTPMVETGSDACADRPDGPHLGAAGFEPSPSAQERLSRLVRTIEADLIPRLVQAHRLAPEPQAHPERSEAAATSPTAAQVDHFVASLLAEEGEALNSLVKSFVDAGMSIATIYLDVLAPAASRLGEMWEDDTADFAEVTISVGRLQRIMRTLSPLFDTQAPVAADGRRALLVPAPGEQHTFGLSMVAEFFRRSGWEVVGGVGPDLLDPVRAVRDEWFDVIGISVGHESRLEWLTSGVAAVRRASRNRGIGVMVGGPAFIEHPERVREVGADATARDGQEAPHVAESLLERRASRL